jgi:hypothetical protein
VSVETDSVATDPKQSDGAQTVVPEMDVLGMLSAASVLFRSSIAGRGPAGGLITPTKDFARRVPGMYDEISDYVPFEKRASVSRPGFHYRLVCSDHCCPPLKLQARMLCVDANGRNGWKPDFGALPSDVGQARPNRGAAICHGSTAAAIWTPITSFASCYSRSSSTHALNIW